MKIQTILTDNVSQFTNRFTAQGKWASRTAYHRLVSANQGMIERFHECTGEVVKQTRLACAAELKQAISFYLKTYNHHIPQRASKHQTAIQALQEWRDEKPDLFVKRVYKQPGLDN